MCLNTRQDCGTELTHERAQASTTAIRIYILFFVQILASQFPEHRQLKLDPGPRNPRGTMLNIVRGPTPLKSRISLRRSRLTRHGSSRRAPYGYTPNEIRSASRRRPLESREETRLKSRDARPSDARDCRLSRDSSPDTTNGVETHSLVSDSRTLFPSRRAAPPGSASPRDHAGQHALSGQAMTQMPDRRRGF
jgi:hypothetical protein